MRNSASEAVGGFFEQHVGAVLQRQDGQRGVGTDGRGDTHQVGGMLGQRLLDGVVDGRGVEGAGLRIDGGHQLRPAKGLHLGDGLEVMPAISIDADLDDSRGGAHLTILSLPNSLPLGSLSPIPEEARVAKRPWVVSKGRDATLGRGCLPVRATTLRDRPAVASRR